MGNICILKKILPFEEIKINQNTNNINSNFENLNDNNNNDLILEKISLKEKLKSKTHKDNFSKLKQFKDNLDINRIKQKLISLKDKTFNYPEVDIYIGEGLKKIKGYISKKGLYELKDERKKFWKCKKKGNKKIWEELEKICEDESISDNKIYEILEFLEIVTLYNCINICIDLNENIYEIPNYCIQNPYEYDLKIYSYTDNDRPNQKEININVSYLNKNFVIKMSNIDTIQDFKAEILNLDDFIHLDDNCISLYYNGKELDDNKEIWMYDINNNSKIILDINNNYQ